MYIEQFVYLKAISETRSLRLAGERLFVTEQALSSAIRKLEKECGVPLLNRSNKGVTLNEHGQYVLEKGELILQCLEDIQGHFSRHEGEIISLRVMASSHLMENLLSPVMMHYHQNVVKVRLIAEAAEYETIVDALKVQTCNIGVISSYVVNEKQVNKLDTRIQYDEIFSMPLLIAVAPESPLAKMKKERVSYEDLAQYPAIVKVSSVEKNDFVLKRAMQFENHRILYAPNSKSARIMLKKNMGWMVSPYTDESKELESTEEVRYLRLEDEIEVSVGVCYLKENEKMYSIQEFKGYMQQLCAKEFIHELN